MFAITIELIKKITDDVFFSEEEIHVKVSEFALL